MLRKRLPLTAWVIAPLAAAAVLGGCSVRYDTVDSTVVRGQQLTPCGIEGTPFADVEFKDWIDVYHRRVGEVVDEFFSTDDQSQFVVDCTTFDEGDGSAIAPAGSKLRAMAEELAPWADGQREVTRLTTGDVLRTYLDTYLCSLHEMRYKVTLTADGAYASGAGSSQSQGSSTVVADRGDVNDWVVADREAIDHQLLTAGPALERVLALMSADHRTAALKTELQCILRASTDLRNTLALFSEATACIGRLWDAQGVFRDFPSSVSAE